MKVIFLDIDGVLVNRNTLKGRSGLWRREGRCNADETTTTEQELVLNKTERQE